MKLLLSIIIPTLNEERYLPQLLKSLQEQTYSNFKVIIADHNSRDKTRKIARKYHAQIVTGGLPAKARNAGAKIARGEILFFLDADTVLRPDFLEKISRELITRNCGLGLTKFKTSSKNPLDKIIFAVQYYALKTLQHLKPHGMGFALVIKKDLFNQVKGFNEKIILGEDVDLIVRAAQHAKFRILTSSYLYVSARRFQQDGRLKTCLRLLKSTLFDFLGKKITKNSGYKFGHYR